MTPRRSGEARGHVSAAFVPAGNLRRPTKRDQTIAELNKLRPFFGGLTEHERKTVELRCNGILPAEIAERLGRSGNGVNITITYAKKKLYRLEARAGAETMETIDYPADVERPKTRADCAEMPRPCPFVSCVHHLFLDVDHRSGSIRLNFPHLEVWEMEESCSLDVADRGGETLDVIGGLTNRTRERVRQIEMVALRKCGERLEETTIDRCSK